MQCESAWHCSAPIRQKTYQILSASNISTIDNNNNIPTITEHHRDGTNIVKVEVEVEDSEETRCLTLDKLYEKPVEERLRLFYKTLGITADMIAAGVVDPGSPDRRDNDILTAIIIYWTKHSQPRANKE